MHCSCWPDVLAWQSIGLFLFWCCLDWDATVSVLESLKDNLLKTKIMERNHLKMARLWRVITSLSQLWSFPIMAWLERNSLSLTAPSDLACKPGLWEVSSCPLADTVTLLLDFHPLSMLLCFPCKLSFSGHHQNAMPLAIHTSPDFS